MLLLNAIVTGGTFWVELLLTTETLGKTMANIKGPRDHSPKIEKLAAQKLRDPNASRDTKRLAGAVLAHADGKPSKPASKPPRRR